MIDPEPQHVFQPDLKELYQLFPKGPGKLAARVSGLPKPQGCI